MKMTKDWLQQMLGRMFSPISRREALRIVADALADHARSAPLICHGAKPDDCRIYNTPSEPCWYIYVPWTNDNNGMAVLRSSRVILVGKLTGMIHYDGSAGDEG
ncbi:MAG: hypothetical protein M0P95_12930 [Sulfuritalea sp.]|jgi:hypothetical protein|nr:hypothetical protein [Sulfuritalea sp.]